MLDVDELVDVGEVATILGLSKPNSVTTYMKRYADFPRPAIEFAHNKCRMWVRADIESWMRKTGRDT